MDASLGVTADIFRRMPDVRRSNHPFAFAALGPHAAAITADPLPLPPHRLESPVGRVYEMDGKVLLLGVGHNQVRKRAPDIDANQFHRLMLSVSTGWGP